MGLGDAKALPLTMPLDESPSHRQKLNDCSTEHHSQKG